MTRDDDATPPGETVRAMRRLAWLAGSFAAMVGLVVAFIATIDRPAGLWARRIRKTHNGLHEFFKEFSDIARAEHILVPAAALLVVGLIIRRRTLVKWMLMLFVSVGASGLIVNLLKLLFARHRPKELAAEGEFGFEWFAAGSELASFPSGHATAAMGAAVVLAMIFPRWRWWMLGVGGVLAASRVPAGYHYPSDVVAGMWLGAVCTLGVRAVWIRQHPGTFPASLAPIRTTA